MKAKKMLGSKRGFTIIEILVALGIGAIVMAGTVQMFRSNRDAFSLLEQVKNMETNARISIDFMARDLRAAGRGLGGGSPFWVWDNNDAGAVDGSTYAALATQLNAKPGTDIVEIFYSFLPEPIFIEDGDFNEVSATLQIPQESLVGLPGYSTSMTNSQVGDLLDDYTALIYDENDSSKRCEQNITGGNFAAGNTRIGYNRGMNTDYANRPHDCCPTPATCLSNNVYFTIGVDYYYFVDNTDATNPKLVRESLSDNVGPEVIANHTDDFQILLGEDANTNGTLASAEWVDGDALVTASGENVRMVRVSVMVKTPKEDFKKTAQAPTALENSSISGLGTPDNYRRRIITRTVRLRNMGN